MLISRAMQLSDFYYNLPEELIAQYPPKVRGDSRLMVVNGAAGKVDHLHFKNFVDLLNRDDLLVFNDTRVIPARLFGAKATGGRVEIMLERVLDEKTVLVKIRASKSPKPGQRLILEEQLEAEVKGREGEFFELKIFADSVLDAFQQYGHIPLPPYIKREDQKEDAERYQTVFAKNPGAVAAPTAGLHFNDAFFDDLDKKRINYVYITLHVGAGTFQPVRSQNLDSHTLHSEYMDVPAAVVDRINLSRKRGGRIIAIGTTVVRSLEAAAAEGNQLKPFSGDSQLFLKPGSRFNVVDAMVTNFHLPQSTLLMLVSAFAGLELTLEAYSQAVEQQYRFFSYGDAMFVLPNRAEWELK